MRRVVPAGWLSDIERWWLIGCATLFVLVTADVVAGGLFVNLDHVVRDHVQPRQLTAPWILNAAGFFGAVETGGAAVVLVAAIVSWRWRRWYPVVVVTVSLACFEAFILVAKLAVSRRGPGLQAYRTDYPGYYPSGHTATVAVCAGVVGYLAMVVAGRAANHAALVAQVIGVVAGLMGGADAVLLDTHWLSDVIGGLIVASATTLLSCAALRSSGRAGPKLSTRAHVSQRPGEMGDPDEG